MALIYLEYFKLSQILASYLAGDLFHASSYIAFNDPIYTWEPRYSCELMKLEAKHPDMQEKR